MAWCLTAPSHCLNKCWIIIIVLLLHSPENNFTRNAMNLISNMCLEIMPLQPHLQRIDEEFKKIYKKKLKKKKEKKKKKEEFKKCVNEFENHTLNHWGWMTHICVNKLTIPGSDNGLSPGRHQAFIWTNIGIMWIGPLGTNFSEILIEIHEFSFKKMHLKMLSAKCRSSCLNLNVLKSQ